MNKPAKKSSFLSLPFWPTKRFICTYLWELVARHLLLLQLLAVWSQPRDWSWAYEATDTSPVHWLWEKLFRARKTHHCSEGEKRVCFSLYLHPYLHMCVYYVQSVHVMVSPRCYTGWSSWEQKLWRDLYWTRKRWWTIWMKSGYYLSAGTKVSPCNNGKLQ